MMNHSRSSILEKTSFHLLLIAIIGLAAYSNTFGVPFQFDDFNNISDNPVIKDLGNFTSSLIGYRYNPRRYIGYLTLALNYRFGGPDVTWYHAANIAFHILNGVLVYFLVYLTCRTPYFGAWGRGQRAEGKEQSAVSDSRFAIHDSRSFIALFAALLFVSHPIQTQAVTYIVQRFTSLATMFYLLSLVMYIKGRLSAISNRQSAISGQRSGENSRFTIHDSRFTIVWYLLSLLSAVLAMKTKEIAFTLPIIMLLYELTFYRSDLKKKLLFLIPIFLTILIIPVSMMHVDKPLGEMLSDLSEKTRVQTEISRGDYLMTEMRVIVTYIRLLFFPANQNLDYDYPIYRSFLNPEVFLSFLFLCALLGTAGYLMYKTQSEKLKVKSEKSEQTAGNLSPSTFHLLRLIAFGILWFFITLSVESSIIPIADVIFEHRVYLPSVGFFIALVAGATFLFTRFIPKTHSAPPSPLREGESVDAKSTPPILGGVSEGQGGKWNKFPDKPPLPLLNQGGEFGRRFTIHDSRFTKVAAALFALLILVLASATYARNKVWRDGLVLWEDVARKAPANPRAQNNLGYVYNARGMTAEAMEHFIAAVRISPKYLDARINLGIAYNAKGMTDKAIEQFTIALRMNQNDADAHNNIGISYVSKGMIDEAIAHYLSALRLNPYYPEAYNNLGVAYGYKDMPDRAIPYVRNAIRLKPDYFEAHYNLALLFLRKNDIADAEEEYKRLAVIEPEAAKKLLDLIRRASR